MSGCLLSFGRLIFGERATYACWIRVSVGSNAGVEGLVKGEIPYPYLESNSDCTAHNQSLYCIRYSSICLENHAMSR